MVPWMFYHTHMLNIVEICTYSVFWGVLESMCKSFDVDTHKMSNVADILGDTCMRHAKDMEANCTKAMFLCISEDSPWKNYKGSLKS